METVAREQNTSPAVFADQSKKKAGKRKTVENEAEDMPAKRACGLQEEEADADPGAVDEECEPPVPASSATGKGHDKVTKPAKKAAKAEDSRKRYTDDFISELEALETKEAFASKGVELFKADAWVGHNNVYSSAYRIAQIQSLSVESARMRARFCAGLLKKLDRHLPVDLRGPFRGPRGPRGPRKAKATTDAVPAQGESPGAPEVGSEKAVDSEE